MEIYTLICNILYILCSIGLPFAVHWLWKDTKPKNNYHKIEKLLIYISVIIMSIIFTFLSIKDLFEQNFYIT